MKATALLPVTGSKQSRFEELVMLANVEIPFVPVVGMMIAVTPDGDFLRVSDVYWHCDKPAMLDVYVEEDGLPHGAPYWRRQGWRTEP